MGGWPRALSTCWRAGQSIARLAGCTSRDRDAARQWRRAARALISSLKQPFAHRPSVAHSP
jgi:hypothetical protein